MTDEERLVKATEDGDIIELPTFCYNCRAIPAKYMTEDSDFYCKDCMLEVLKGG